MTAIVQEAEPPLLWDGVTLFDEAIFDPAIFDTGGRGLVREGEPPEVDTTEE